MTFVRLPAVLAVASAALVTSSTLATDIGTPPISAPISGCGEVVFDEICEKLFKFDNGGFYSFSGLDAYAIGERLHVAGEVCLICLLTPCGNGYSAIFDATIGDCEGFPGVPVSGCMEVVADPECGPLLMAEDGTLYYADGWVTAEQEGLRFHVEGEYSADLLVLCPGNPVPEAYPFFIDLTLTGCSGDLDFNGVIDGADLGLLLNAFGTSCMVQDPCFADLNHDGFIDGSDVGLLLAAWQ